MTAADFKLHFSLVPYVHFNRGVSPLLMADFCSGAGCEGCIQAAAEQAAGTVPAALQGGDRKAEPARCLLAGEFNS